THTPTTCPDTRRPTHEWDDRRGDFYGARKQDHSRYRESDRRYAPQREIAPHPELGLVISVKESFGFIRSPEREEDIFFHFSELPPEVPPQIGHYPLNPLG